MNILTFNVDIIVMNIIMQNMYVMHKIVEWCPNKNEVECKGLQRITKITVLNMILDLDMIHE